MATPPDELVPLVAALETADAAYGSRIQPDGSDMRASQPPWRRFARQGVPPRGLDLGRGPGPGHPVRVQGLPARGGPRRVRAPEDHEHRVRRRGDLPRPAPRLPPRGGAHPLGRPARLAHAPGPAARAAGGVGPVPDPAGPPRRRGARRMVRRSTAPPDPRSRPRGSPRRSGACCRVVAIARPRADRGRDARRRRATRSATTSAPTTRRVACARRAAAVRHVVPGGGRVRPVLVPADLRPARAAARRCSRGGGGVGLDRRCSSPPSASGRALLPVGPTVRWLVVLLAGLSWPFLYAVKLGQVGPAAVPAASRSAGAGWTGPGRWGPPARSVRSSRSSPGWCSCGRLLTRRWRAVAGRRGRARWLAAVAATLLAGPGGVVGLPRAPRPGQRPDHHPAQLHAGRRGLPGRALARRRGSRPVASTARSSPSCS